MVKRQIRNIARPVFFLIACLFPLTNLFAKSDYVTPVEFMNLYFDFSGTHNKNYPKGKINASLALFESEKKNTSESEGDLILFLNSDLYVYDNKKNNLLNMTLRTSPDDGFYEMTAISHVGPALAYYLRVKENGSDLWKPGLEAILRDLKSVRKINAKEQDNWLDKVNAPAWETFKPQIHNMIDYACSMAGNYIQMVLKTGDFTEASLTKQFFTRSDDSYPIPYNNVMIATFMLTVLQELDKMHTQLASLNIDWAKARVIIRNVAGTNVTSGLTVGSNWLVPSLEAFSNGKLPSDRIMIAAYAEVKSDVGNKKLSEETYDYYSQQVWGGIYNRTRIAKEVFSYIPSIYVAGRASLPGDFSVTKADDISDFIIRLKYSLANQTQMLSNTVAFWMAGEFHAAKANPAKVRIPGLTTGFKQGITGYPASNPEISL